MFEVIFNGKCGDVCDVKIISLAENQDLNDSNFNKFLDKEELRILTKAIESEKFKGKNGEYVDLYSEKGRILIVGLGCQPKKLDLQKIGASLIEKMFKNQIVNFWVDNVLGCELTKEEIAHQVAFGMLLGSYRFDKYFTKKKEDEYLALEKVCFCSVDGEVIALNNFMDYASLANAVRYARDLVNEPANFLTPEVFADDIKRLEYLKMKVEIFDKKAMQENDFNMVLEVAKGATSEPKVAILIWQGDKGREEFDTVMVGKGVTYDAGGINIKTGKNFENMYADMAGAAAVVAAMKSIALERRIVNVAAIVGLVENMPSGGALRPFDVIRSMSGQTVEVVDTDGEGRLILADLLWYAQKRFNATQIIDVATLTGTVAYALGGQYAGIYGNDQKLIAELIKSGEECGEPLWQLPMNEEFDKWIKSDIADMKNVGKKIGDGSQAAAFLQRYIKRGVKWAHIDMADMEISDGNNPLTPKGATGYGVRLLNQYIKTHLMDNC